MIQTPKIRLSLSIEEVERLHIHEEIIPRILDWLTEKIYRDRVFKDPVIVDERTLVVLDGMHRVAAAKRLGLKYIPVCLVDYENPSIELHAWGRVFTKKGENKVDSIVSELGLELANVESIEEGMKLLDERKGLGLLISRNSTQLIRTDTSEIKKIYDRIKEIEKHFESYGFKIDYMTERDSINAVLSGSATAALIPPAIRKTEVVEKALRGEVFIHKATRHIIPARPLNINIPLEWLSGNIPKEEVIAKVREIVSSRKIRILPPGSILDRRYDEELYVFE
ncbi:ParB N-terminal domain-containing protein [Thermogladius sp. 4427co]|uniref:ParB N-terminal domain-containing protein n=1 Tax=Thermogladius sp. 4427co TaxID=3450718 RepID=UPI003F7B22EE